jgi:hypothetical protein
MDVKPFAGPWEHDDEVIAWWGGSLKGVRVSFPQIFNNDSSNQTSS